jgi:hypothetical protein
MEIPKGVKTEPPYLIESKGFKKPVKKTSLWTSAPEDSLSSAGDYKDGEKRL